MNKNFFKISLILTITFVYIIATNYSNPVYAYINPGLSITVFGSIIAVIVAFFVAIFGILFWPIKALIRKLKKNKKNVKTKEEDINTVETENTARQEVENAE